MSALYLNDKKVLGMGMLQDNLFALIDLETNGITQHGKLPFKPKNAGNNFYWELNSGSIFLTPDKKHLIFTAMYFGYIACYKLENEAFSLEWEHWITDVKYTMSNGRIYFKNDNLIGFMNAAVTNEKIYAIYHGEGMHAMRADDPNQPKTIMVFSIKGEPLAKYRTDCPILRIGLNPQGEVFCVSNPLVYDLVKFNIK